MIYSQDSETEELTGSFFESCKEIKWFFMERSSHYMFGSKPYGVCAELIIRDMIKHCKGNFTNSWYVSSTMDFPAQGLSSVVHYCKDT